MTPLAALGIGRPDKATSSNDKEMSMVSSVFSRAVFVLWRILLDIDECFVHNYNKSGYGVTG